MSVVRPVQFDRTRKRRRNDKASAARKKREAAKLYLQRAICRMTCFVEPGCQWLDGSIANDNQAHTRPLSEKQI